MMSVKEIEEVKKELYNGSMVPPEIYNNLLEDTLGLFTDNIKRADPKIIYGFLYNYTYKNNSLILGGYQGKIDFFMSLLNNYIIEGNKNISDVIKENAQKQIKSNYSDNLEYSNNSEVDKIKKDFFKYFKEKINYNNEYYYELVKESVSITNVGLGKKGKFIKIIFDKGVKNFYKEIYELSLKESNLDDIAEKYVEGASFRDMTSAFLKCTFGFNTYNFVSIFEGSNDYSSI